MTTEFFTISDDTLSRRGFPWAYEITRGMRQIGTCHTCAEGSGRALWTVEGDIDVRLERNIGVRWPDAIGCGHKPIFIASRRLIDAWREDGVGEFPINRVTILPPLPKKLEGTKPPEYWWINGSKMVGVEIDFEGSGFVDPWICPDCGTMVSDIGATHNKQHSGDWPYKFVPSSWNGAHIFTAAFSPNLFFCTERVVDCARKHKFLNLRFVPIARAASSSEGIKYK